MSERLEAFGNETPSPKSISHSKAIERNFAKGNDDELGNRRSEKKDNQFSMSLQKAEVVELLDQATFAKGYDDEFSHACVAFESGAPLSKSVITRMKNEFGVEIIK